ncbi:hypothetical protein GTP91_20555 [Rugamonas sp. FT82W]|uniref:Uncharacterized protein n=1 Tax=Duganella vulcania TaxID=2692166 RepID=A0A845G8N7_9BURK|nr:hypothetical protein [Duganella vulcania]MYM89556.1 hypothetical protein [Duganella vulcania]
MATGIIGALAGGTLTYIAPLDAKLSVSIVGSSQYSPVTINGIPVVNFNTTSNLSLSHFIGAGQLVTIVVPGGTSCIVSALEGS